MLFAVVEIIFAFTSFSGTLFLEARSIPIRRKKNDFFLSWPSSPYFVNSKDKLFSFVRILLPRYYFTDVIISHFHHERVTERREKNLQRRWKLTFDLGQNTLRDNTKGKEFLFVKPEAVQ
jgi:hypothetical protein